MIFTIIMLIRAKMTHFWVLYLKKYLLYGYFCEIPKNSVFYITYLFWIENCVLWQKLSGKNTLLLNFFTEKWKYFKSNDFPRKKSVFYITYLFWIENCLLWQKLSGKNTLLLNFFTEKWKYFKSNDFPRKKSIMIC